MARCVLEDSCAAARLRGCAARAGAGSTQQLRSSSERTDSETSKSSRSEVRGGSRVRVEVVLPE